jgi:hypothetical protein
MRRGLVAGPSSMQEAIAGIQRKDATGQVTGARIPT